MHKKTISEKVLKTCIFAMGGCKIITNSKR